METVIADTGFVVALLNRADVRHQDVTAIYLQRSSILLPQTTLVEIAYLVGRDAGISTVVHFPVYLNPQSHDLLLLPKGTGARVESAAFVNLPLVRWFSDRED